MKVQMLMLFLLGVLWPVAGLAQQKPRPQQTIDNLQAAIQGEANASHRYSLFAYKADLEGFPQVAKLFRAAALAESIHRRNHERVLRGLGVEPRPLVLEDVTVSTTRKNLEIPIRGEREEEETGYPRMVVEARREHVPVAVQTFTYALNTEAQHLKLFEDALAKLGKNPQVDYYVSEVSGETTTRPPVREPSTKVE